MVAKILRKIELSMFLMKNLRKKSFIADEYQAMNDFDV